MPRSILSALCLIAFAQPDLLGQEDGTPFATERAEAEAELLPQLVELARWCQAQRLFGERDQLWYGVLRLDPEHREARRVLRYRRSGDGWIQSKSYSPGTDRNEAARPVFSGRYARIIGPHKTRLFRLIEAHRRSVGPELREEVLGHLVLIDPDDAQVRAALGEIWDAGRWVLNESQRTLRKRDDLALFARAALEWAPEPEVVEMTDTEAGIALPLNAPHATSAVRVVGTVHELETKATARLSHAAEHYFEHVFRRRQEHRDGFTIFLLSGLGQREALIQAFEVDAGDADLERQAAGGWLRSNILGEWSADPNRRTDGAARQTLGAMLMDAYGIDGRHGWAWEGFGLYLAYQLTGTRMTYFIDRSDYKTNRPTTLWPKLQNPATDWMAEGRALLTGPNAPKLEFLLGRNVNLMRDEDLLFGYLLAAYLLEGWPREAPDLLRRIGAGEHPISAFETELGYTLPQIERRLLRWLEETR